VALDDDEDKLIELNLIIEQAYAVLGDEERRRAYDETLSRAAAELEPATDTIGAELYFQEGQALLKQRDLAGAVDAFRRAAQENPDQPDYHAHLGWAVFLSEGRGVGGAKAARPHLEHALRIAPESVVLQTIAGAMRAGSYTYNVLYMLLIFLFAYFWVTVQFQPREMAKNLRDSGSFIPGLRPGRRTAEYLETVMTRITYYGAAFLAGIAVIPTVLSYALGIDWTITTFVGGTGLLIVVSVSLDLVQKIEANLLMRSYDGFSPSGRIKGAYS